MRSHLYDVFLCHSGEERDAVVDIAEALIQLGVEPWLDAWELTADERWQDKIVTALPLCGAFLVVIGARGVRGWDFDTVEPILVRHIDENKRFRVIAAILPEFKGDLRSLPALLTAQEPVRMRGANDEQALRVLVDRIHGKARLQKVPGNADARCDRATLIARIKAEDPGAYEDLHAMLASTLRRLMLVHSARVDEDDLEEILVAVLEGIRAGELDRPDRLEGFAAYIARRVMFNRRVRNSKELAGSRPGAVDRGIAPDEAAMHSERLAIARQLLAELEPVDREILTRFYLDEQSGAEICHEMKLEPSRFRSLKTRAKERLEDIGRNRLTHTQLAAVRRVLP